MERENQLFTFGCGHTFANRFVVIEAETKERCREIMFETFDCKWSMQYDYEDKQKLESHGMKAIVNITELSDGRRVTEMREQTIVRL
ncbi:hypothetical protein S1R3Y_000021 [Vibrio phage vB_ValP_VA-RY-3]|nr:hypothetical protein S1R3Y_000021 [Vibrio phage vB_ValP_VA-RY-3]